MHCSLLSYFFFQRQNFSSIFLSESYCSLQGKQLFCVKMQQTAANTGNHSRAMLKSFIFKCLLHFSQRVKICESFIWLNAEICFLQQFATLNFIVVKFTPNAIQKLHQITRASLRRRTKITVRFQTLRLAWFVSKMKENLMWSKCYFLESMFNMKLFFSCSSRCVIFITSHFWTWRFFSFFQDHFRTFFLHA